ncbi:MAG: hypothetical protein ACYTXT_10830 [Nostoc sp.]|uniref:hypothetical protein n=1 Tax=Nostoc sp. TaxID=1180 RepID=UPI002FF2181B
MKIKLFMKIALVAWGYIPEPPLPHPVLTVIQEYKHFTATISEMIDKNQYSRPQILEYVR